MQTLRTSLPIQTQMPVKIIDDESQARLIFDPMRREMIRLLSRKPLTEKELSNTIGISPPTVHHHLKALVHGELISMVRKEVGAHGIVQKRYASNAQAYIVDRDNLRDSVRRYFMPMDIERSRGITATVSFLRGTITPSTKQMENLTKQICTALSKTAQRYHGGPEDDPEKIIHRLYVEALGHVEI